MASTMKFRVAGFLRSLLRHMDDQPAARRVAAAVPPPTCNAAPVTPSSDTEIQSRPAAPTAASAKATEIQIPLAAVIAHLPMDLKAKLTAAPAARQMISLGVDTVVQQLAFGSVKITFAELRRLAPGLFASSGGEFDVRPVALPLQEILTRLNPSVLARRTVQKVDVAEEVAGPFDGRGRGITFTTQPLKAAVATPTVTEPTPAAVAPRHVTPTTSGGTEIFTFTPRQTALAPSTPIPFNPNPPLPGNGNGNGHGHSNGHANGNGNGHAVLPPFKFTTAPTLATPAASSLPRPEPAQSVLLVSLDDLAEGWPEALRQEILRSNFANASAPLPLGLVEAGLKRGRVTMTWKALRTLTKPSSLASPNDELSLDLPLKILAPAFFSAQKQPGGTQKKLAVAEEIPNLFYGFPQAAPAAARPSAPVAPTLPKPVDTNFYVWGENGELPQTDEQTIRQTTAPATDFMTRHTHPSEVVARAVILPGVAGAVVALADGLRVASQVPATLSGDTVAAFLPQIFERVNQSTRELRMGALNNVSFTVGNVPWKIFRVNSVYFAAFGRVGEVLPKAQLAGLAAELDRKNKL